jgi:hypothetical protein
MTAVATCRVSVIARLMPDRPSDLPRPPQDVQTRLPWHRVHVVPKYVPVPLQVPQTFEPPHVAHAMLIVSKRKVAVACAFHVRDVNMLPSGAQEYRTCHVVPDANAPAEGRRQA